MLRQDYLRNVHTCSLASLDSHSSSFPTDHACQKNGRFATYCPYCQITSAPSLLPQRLRDPPAYTSVPSTHATTANLSTAPPPYTPAADSKGADPEKSLAHDALHFLDHEHDSIASLSLRYGVGASVLRRRNNITSDNLLLGRKTILIPGGGVSLSPRPVEGEEEELKKSKIRRMMTSCKIVQYDIALLYLEQSGYDLGAAVDSYLEDDVWEKNNPRRKLGKDDVAGTSCQRRGLVRRGL